METKIIFGLLGLFGCIHLLIASLSTIELKELPPLVLPNKLIWLFIIWFLPLIGTYLFHKKANIKIQGGASTRGDCSTGGGDGYGD